MINSLIVKAKALIKTKFDIVTANEITLRAPDALPKGQWDSFPPVLDMDIFTNNWLDLFESLVDMFWTWLH